MSRQYTFADVMAVGMARILQDGETVFTGVNSILPMVAVALARRTQAPNLTYINIAGGINPAPRFLPESSTDPELTRGSAAIWNNEDFYDLCARGGVDTVFLGAVQVDGAGRINNSVIGPYDKPKVRLPGGGGAAMILPTAGRVVVWRTRHDRRSFVEKLDFVTGVGNLDRVVTPLCVFQRRQGRLELECLQPGVSPLDVVENTGFPVNLPDKVLVALPPTQADLRLLEEIDPKGVRHLEFT